MDRQKIVLPKKVPKNTKIEKLMEYLTILYENPKEFITKISELQSLLVKPEEFFDYTDTPVLNHYFIAQSDFKHQKKMKEYDILHQNYFKYLEAFKQYLNIQDSKGNTLLHFLAKNNLFEEICSILEKFTSNNEIDFTITNKDEKSFASFIKSDKLGDYYQKINQLAPGMLTEFHSKSLESKEDAVWQSFKDKKMKSFLENIENISICLPDMKYFILRSYVDRDLIDQIEPLFQSIKKGNNNNENSINTYFANFNFDITHCIRKSDYITTTSILKIYERFSLNDMLLKSDEFKSNVYHSLAQNDILSNEEKTKIIEYLKKLLADKAKDLMNSPDRYGYIPLYYFLSNENYLMAGYEKLLNIIYDNTDINTYSNKNFNLLESKVFGKGRRSRYKNLTYPPPLSVSLVNCSNSKNFQFLFDYLTKKHQTNVFSIEKISKKSVLSIILQKGFKNIEIYNSIISSIDLKCIPMSNINNNYYYDNFSSCIKLLLKNKEKISANQIRDIIFSHNTLIDFISKQSKDKVLFGVHLKNFTADVLDMVSNLLNKYTPFISENDEIYAAFDTLDTDKNSNYFRNNLNIFFVDIKKTTKLPYLIPQNVIDSMKSSYKRNTFVLRPLKEKTMIDFINTLNKYEDFRDFVLPMLTIVSDFLGYDLLQYLLENLSDKQANYLLTLVKESSLIKNMFFDSNNPILLYAKFKAFLKFIKEFKKEKNIYQFLRIIELSLCSSINLRNLFNIYVFICEEEDYQAIYPVRRRLKKKTKQLDPKEHTTSISMFFKALSVIFPNKFSDFPKQKDKFFLFSLQVLFYSKNNQLIENLIQIIEYSEYKDYAPFFRKIVKEKINNLSEITIYQEEQSKFELKFEGFISSFNGSQQKINMLNRKINAFLGNNLISSSFKWLSIFAYNQNYPVTKMFFSVSYYYITLFDEKTVNDKKLLLTNHYLSQIAPLIDEVSGKIKKKLKEHEQLLLVKSFIYNFKGESKLTDLQKVLDQCKTKLSIADANKEFKPYSLFCISLTIIRIPEINLLYSVNRDITANLVNLMTMFIGECFAKNTIYKEDLLRFAPYCIMRIVNTGSVIFLANSNLVTVNIWFFLYNGSIYRDKDTISSDVRKLADEIKSKNDPSYLFTQDSDATYKRSVDFDVFLQNLEMFKDVIDGIVESNNYFTSTFAIVVYYALEQIKIRNILENKEKLSKLIDICKKYKMFDCINNRSIKLFEKIVTIYCIIIAKIKSPKDLSAAFNKILDNLFKSLQNGYAKFSDVLSLISSTLFSLLKLKTTDNFDYFVENLIKVKPEYLKEIFKQTTITDILFIYCVFNDNIEYLKKLEIYFANTEIKYFLKPIELDKQYLFTSLFTRQNTFTKFLSRYFNSNVIYLAILNKSTKMIDYLQTKLSFTDLYSHFVSKANEVKTGLNIALLISKEKNILSQFPQEVFSHSENEMMFISKYFKSKKDFELLKASYYTDERYSLNLIKFAIVNNNMELFKYIYLMHKSQQEITFLNENRTNMALILQFLIEHDQYSMFLELNFKQEQIQDLSEVMQETNAFLQELYNERPSIIHPLFYAAQFKAFYIFVLLMKCNFPPQKIFDTIVSNNNFMLNLQRKFNKEDKFSDFCKKNNPEYYSLLSICNGVNLISTEYLNKCVKTLSLKNSFSDIVPAADVAGKAAIFNECNYNSSVEHYLNAINCLLLSKQHSVAGKEENSFGEKFFKLISVTNNRNLVRFVLYMCVIELNLFPNSSFLETLLNRNFNKRFLDELLVFDMFYYFEALGFQLLSVSSYYKKIDLGKDLFTLKKLSDAKNVDKDLLKKIKKDNLSQFNSLFGTFKSSFEMNKLQFLINCSGYSNLLPMIYVSNNYQFNDIELLNIYISNPDTVKGDLLQLIPYYFSKQVMISQQLMSSDQIFEFNIDKGEEADEKSDYMATLSVEYSQIFNLFVSISATGLNFEFFESFVQFNSFICGQFNPLKYKLDKIESIFNNFNIILNEIEADDNAFFFEFFEKNKSNNNLCFSAIDNEKYFEETFNGIIEVFDKEVSAAKVSVLSIDIKDLLKLFEIFAARFQSFKNYKKPVTKSKLMNSFLEKFSNFPQFILIFLRVIKDVRKVKPPKKEIKLSFQYLEEKTKKNSFPETIKNNIDGILNNLLHPEIGMSIVIPFELSKDYFNPIDSIFALPISQAMEKVFAAVDLFDDIREYFKKGTLFEQFINEHETFLNKSLSDETVMDGIFFENYKGLLKIKYEFISEIIKVGPFKFVLDPETGQGVTKIQKLLNGYFDANVGISSSFNMKKSETHFQINPIFIEQLNSFVNDYSNYEIHPIRTYLQLFFANEKKLHIYTKYNSLELNFFESHKKFNVFFDLISDRLLFLRNLNMKFVDAKIKFDFVQFENIISGFVVQNEKDFKGEIDTSVLSNVFYTQKNSMSVLLEYVLELSLYTDDRIDNFSINLKLCKQPNKHLKSFKSSQITGEIKETLNMFDMFFLINSISITRSENEGIEFMNITIEIYYEALTDDFFKKQNISEFLKSRRKSLNDDLIKIYTDDAELRGMLKKGIQG